MITETRRLGDAWCDAGPIPSRKAEAVVVTVGTDALEPPMDEPCPDCRAEVGEPCTWDCSSRWT